jgi:hypothetical protein
MAAKEVICFPLRVQPCPALGFNAQIPFEPVIFLPSGPAAQCRCPLSRAEYSCPLSARGGAGR